MQFKCQLKLCLGRHLLALFVSQVSVGLHGQGAAVFAPQPAGYTREVNAGFNTAGGEQVAEVVVRYLGKPIRVT